jgi:hypothetical protein
MRQLTTTMILSGMIVVGLASVADAKGDFRVFIEESVTEDISNETDEADEARVDFGVAISAAFFKKDVPVLVVTDRTKSDWTIRSVSTMKEQSTGRAVVSGLFGGGGDKFEGTFQVIDNETTAILYAYNVKKNNFQSAAEAFAKHFKNDFLDKGGVQEREGDFRVFIEEGVTEDISNEADEADEARVDFGVAISAALIKKDVPVLVVTDRTKSEWTITSVSTMKEESTGRAIVSGLFGGGGDKFEGTFQVIDNETTAILYAYNVKKDNFQSAAEAFAKHFKNDFLDKGGMRATRQARK